VNNCNHTKNEEVKKEDEDEEEQKRANHKILPESSSTFGPDEKEYTS
jgi:hypothetical protein